MRVGQNGGPLPFEASFDFGNLLYTFYTFYTDFKKGVFCNTEGRFLQQSLYAERVSQFQAFLATACTQRGTAEEADAM